jgi:hypothetical protein
MENSTATARLESTKEILSLKEKAIRNGGYKKYKNSILEMCAKHKELYDVDLTPKQFL